MLLIKKSLSAIMCVSLDPNSTLLAKFCITRVACKRIFRALRLLGNDFFEKPLFSGVRIAGPNKRKNTNPPTAVDVASGKRTPTASLINASSSRNTLVHSSYQNLYSHVNY